MRTKNSWRPDIAPLRVLCAVMAMFVAMQSSPLVGQARQSDAALIAQREATEKELESIAIIDRKVWDQVQAQFKTNPRRRAGATRAQTPALLKGLIFGPTGAAMSPSHTRRKGRLYRYYITTDVIGVAVA